MQKHWTQLWGTIVQQQASQQKRNLKVDLGKCVQKNRAPFLYLPGAPNSLNLPLPICILFFYYLCPVLLLSFCCTVELLSL